MEITAPLPSNFNLFTLSEQLILQRILEYHCTRQRLELINILSILPNDCRCMARIHDNTQCTRKYKEKSLCGSHINSLPYGRIDDIPLSIVSHEKKYKSKKPTNTNQIDVTKTDLTNYIKTSIISINDTDYLIDDNGILFENNDVHMILGHQLSINQYEWF